MKRGLIGMSAIFCSSAAPTVLWGSAAPPYKPRMETRGPESFRDACKAPTEPDGGQGRSLSSTAAVRQRRILAPCRRSMGHLLCQVVGCAALKAPVYRPTLCQYDSYRAGHGDDQGLFSLALQLSGTLGYSPKIPKAFKIRVRLQKNTNVLHSGHVKLR